MVTLQCCGTFGKSTLQIVIPTLHMSTHFESHIIDNKYMGKRDGMST